jgi:hypothetical protein
MLEQNGVIVALDRVKGMYAGKHATPFVNKMIHELGIAHVK